MADRFLPHLRCLCRFGAWPRLAWALVVAVMVGFWFAGQVPSACRAASLPVAASQRYLLAQAVWRDPGGRAGFAFARTQVYQRYKGLLSVGYSDGAEWIRLTVAPSRVPLGLFVYPAWLDEIALYDPRSPGAPVVLGDHYPASRSAFETLGHSFELPPSAVARQVWLRVQSTSTHVVDAEILRVNRIPAAMTRSVLGAAVYATVLLLMFIVLLVIWLAQPNRLLATYLLRHAAFTYYVVAYLGLPALLLSDWLPPWFFDKAFSVSALAAMPLGLRFDIELLSACNASGRVLRLIKGFVWVGYGLLGLFAFGMERQALELNVQALMLGGVVLIVGACGCNAQACKELGIPKKALVGYYLLVMSVLLAGLVSLTGWVEPHPWALQVLVIQGMVTGLVMSTLLFIRSQRQAVEAQLRRWKLGKTLEDLELEQQRRHKQSQFLHMLMHELKTPLSVVSLALGTQGHREQNLMHAGRAVKEMKAILERCIQADKTGDTAVSGRVEALDPAQVVEETAELIPGLHNRLAWGVRTQAVLHTDRQLLMAIVSNLLHNAARYGGRHAAVTVALEPQTEQGRDGLRLRVANLPGAAGWPDARQVFEKYYRAQGALRESGTGLGLHLARQLTQSLGGSLRYAPTGTEVCFELWLPITPP